MKPKMKLDDLKVNSFITNVDDKMAKTAKGGTITITIALTVSACALPATVLISAIASCFDNCEEQ